MTGPAGEGAIRLCGINKRSMQTEERPPAAGCGRSGSAFVDVFYVLIGKSFALHKVGFLADFPLRLFQQIREKNIGFRCGIHPGNQRPAALREEHFVNRFTADDKYVALQPVGHFDEHVLHAVAHGGTFNF